MICYDPKSLFFNFQTGLAIFEQINWIFPSSSDSTLNIIINTINQETKQIHSTKETPNTKHLISNLQHSEARA